MRQSELKRGKPRRRSKADKERWESAWRPYCEVCGRRGGEETITLHHVVYAQHVRSHGGDEWSRDNALPICRKCHDDHHGAVKRIPVDALLTRNLEFARDLLGEAAQDYFARYYETSIEEAA